MSIHVQYLPFSSSLLPRLALSMGTDRGDRATVFTFGYFLGRPRPFLGGEEAKDGRKLIRNSQEIISITN